MRAGWWAALKPMLLRIHFYVGLFVGPFILVAAVTGLLYTLTPQLEQVVHREQLQVDVGTTTVPLAEQIRTGQQAVPEGTLVEVRPPRDAASPTRVVFSSPVVDADHTRTAFVDPYTGELRGVLTTFGEWLPLRAWFDELHRTLLLGDVGRVYSELAASWLWVLGLSGLALWVLRSRRRRAVRATLLPQRHGGGRARLLSWHGAVGLWAVAGLLFLSVTGLTWSQFAGGNVSQLRQALDWTTPVVSTETVAGAPVVAAAEQPVVAADVLAVAREAGLAGPVAVVPGVDGGAWTVSQVTRSWPVQADSVAIDPTTGRVLERIDFADWSVPAKLARWGIDAHMGLLFGVANQVLLAALALGVSCLVVWGYRMWWTRRPTRGARRELAGPPGRRQPVHPGAALSLAAVAVVVGVAFPVLGISLLGFVALDVARTTLTPSPDGADRSEGAGQQQHDQLADGVVDHVDDDAGPDRAAAAP